MTPREHEIYKLLRDYPFITQEEIAEKLNITRSSVSVHILNLHNKGYILGRGYILAKNPHISVIGGSSIDIVGIPDDDFLLRDSNPGEIKYSLGGVGRNIAENIARLDVNIGLITALGKDQNGEEILKQGKNLGIDFSHSNIAANEPTAVYLSILDEKKDMHVAINQMDINNLITPNFLHLQKDYILNSKVVVLDTNLSIESLEYLLKDLRRDYIVDAVSVIKAKKLKNLLSYLHTLKCNIYEAGMLADINIENSEDAIKAGYKLLDNGIKNVIITEGEKGVHYFNKDLYLHKDSKKIKVKNANGAGDAFTAAIAYGYYHNWDIEKSLDFAIAASLITLLDSNTNSSSFNYDNIVNIQKEKVC